MSLLDKDKSLVKAISLDIKLYSAERFVVVFSDIHKPKKAGAGCLQTVANTEYQADIIEFRDSSKGRALLALNKDAQELVDLYVKVKTETLSKQLNAVYQERHNLKKELTQPLWKLLWNRLKEF